MGTLYKGQLAPSDFKLWDGVSGTFRRDTDTGGTETLNRVMWAGVDILELFGDKTNRNTATINSALDRIGNSQATIWFSPGAWTVTDNITIPSNITVVRPSGATISIASGKTLTINGPFEAGREQVFTGDGSVAGLNDVDLLWFGVGTSVSAANNATYANKATAALSSDGGRVWLAKPGTYQLNNYIEFDTGNVDICFSPGVKFEGTAATYLLYVHGTDRDTRIENVRLKGGEFDGNSQTASIGVVFQYVDNSIIKDVECNDFSSNGISWIGGDGIEAPTEYNNKILNCKGSGNGAFGIIAGKQKVIEVAGNDFRGSGDSDYDIKNCYDFNVHDNKSYNPTEHGINVRHSKQGQDMFGKVVNNEVDTCGKNGIYVHADNGDSEEYEDTTSVMRDIIISNNRVSNLTWNGISLSAAAASETIEGFVISNNIIRLPTIDGIVVGLVRHGTICGNTIYINDLGRSGFYGAIQYSTISGNSIYEPGLSGTTANGIYLQDSTIWAFYSLYNNITGNIIVNGSYGLNAISEEVGGNGDHNNYSANKFVGFTPSTELRTYGSNDIVEMPVHKDFTDVTSTDNTADTVLMTTTIGGFNVGSVIEVRASGIVTDTNGGNKTIKFDLRGTTLTIRAAADDNTDWYFHAYITPISTTQVEIVWEGSDDAGVWQHDLVTESIVTGSGDCQFLCTCSDATAPPGNDTITQKSFTIRRLS